ncbi:hypothetical protein GCM10027040_05140 [Halomonas shantousis]
MKMYKRGVGHRGAQAKPNQTEIRTWWRTLKAKADAGDVEAIEALLRLSAKERQDRAAVHPKGL